MLFLPFGGVSRASLNIDGQVSHFGFLISVLLSSYLAVKLQDPMAQRKFNIQTVTEARQRISGWSQLRGGNTACRDGLRIMVTRAISSIQHNPSALPALLEFSLGFFVLFCFVFSREDRIWILK